MWLVISSSVCSLMGCQFQATSQRPNSESARWDRFLRISKSDFFQRRLLFMFLLQMLVTRVVFIELVQIWLPKLMCEMILKSNVFQSLLCRVSTQYNNNFLIKIRINWITNKTIVEKVRIKTRLSYFSWDYFNNDQVRLPVKLYNSSP